MEGRGEIKVTELKNVGPSRAAALSRLGVTFAGELLTLYPRSYENRGDVKLLSGTVSGENSAVCLTVATTPKKALIRRGMSILKFRAYDESGVAEITYFNQDYLADKFDVGRVFRFYGKVERKIARSGKESYSLSSPAAEEIKNEYTELPPLVPRYPLTASLTQNLVSKLVSEAVSLVKPEEILPEEIRIERQLCNRSYAIRNIHKPESLLALSAAKKRLIFEEFFLFALGISLSSREKKRIHGAPVMPNGDITSLLSLIPYSLTKAQRGVIEDVKRDLSSDIPMQRIIVGDVGSGKTVCAAAAMLIAVKNGFQTALMAPTEILANQHFADLSPLFESLGIRTALLTGSLTAAGKRRVQKELSEGSIDIIIGTHALISEGVDFKKLGLVVTDEQHRFGAKQRVALSEKGEKVHTLYMSATPIPRSMALTIYGDLDISIIDEMPPGRQRVDTFSVDGSYRERLYAFVEKQISQGGQVYVVCPAVEEAEEDGDDDGDILFDDIPYDGDLTSLLFREKRSAPPLKSAIKYSKELAGRFPSFCVAYVHGKMKSAEKDSVMRDFSLGKIQILVSTTVIEVGVNVPNASLMIVENAERFGLSQLHQLRGRVGRGQKKSYCVLVSDSDSESARERLMTMKNMYDGFAIAEKDLEMRGPGDFFERAGMGIRQSGSLRFRIADMSTDTELFTAAFASAKAITEKDPELSAYPELKKEAEKLFFAGNSL
ncbi:MAG: ATP-dependent DNA helicase RecG [Clostridia bacterium]|nr:ATP-dependent DNA helicase RecG [Clostridia bacterium]